MFRDYAKTPPCGWNSWDCFGAGVKENELIENAEYMAKYLLDFGWEYVVCDIQWYEPNATNNDYNNFAELTMDEYGRLLPATNRFPSASDGKGFKPIADYCHSLGLKFGIHMMRGIPRQAVYLNTPVKDTEYKARDIAHHFSVCSWNTDMYGLYDCEGAQAYYDSVISLYASWGVDFIKCDDICVTEFRKWDSPYNARHEVEMLRRSIDKCGREIVLSLSPGPADINNAQHLSENANMWRLTGDFWDSWDKLLEMFDRCKNWSPYIKSGNWPDCDMLPLGRISKNGCCCGEQNRYSRFTKPEQLTLMTLFGIFKSPLMFGGNLPENDEWTLSLLTNREYMLMHSTCYKPHELYRNGDVIAWVANGNKCKYLALFNIGDNERQIDFCVSTFLMPDTEYCVYELWTGKAEHVIETLSCKIDTHGAKLYKIL